MESKFSMGIYRKKILLHNNKVMNTHINIQAPPGNANLSACMFKARPGGQGQDGATIRDHSFIWKYIRVHL